VKPKKQPVKEAKDGTITKLKQRIRRLEKENERLRQEVKTLEAYKNITNKYIDDELDGIPVEKVIRSVEKHHNLNQIKDEVNPACRNCLNPNPLKLGRPDGSVVIKCLKCGHQEVVKDE
jgi:predicted nuclease with TOPRIM domain